MPDVFMIAGPNGAGKTTSAMDLLPQLLDCEEYVNADAIAAGLSPFKPESQAFQAGRLMLERVHSLANQGRSFAFETTGASRGFLPFLLKCREKGYTLNLLYVWLHSPEIAIKRVADRVSQGGHDIPEEIIIRRYHKGLKNILNLYMPEVDNYLLIDNSDLFPVMLGEKIDGKITSVKNENEWKHLTKEKT